MAELKKDWTLNQTALNQILNWLDAGWDSHGESYLEMRRRLVFYFDRKNCFSPDDLADETLNRVARKLEEKGGITNVSPAHYCYIVAKFVFLESVRGEKHTGKSVEEITESGAALPALTTPSRPGEAAEGREKMLKCLEHCLARLPSDDRNLIVEYYQSERKGKIERRSGLAARLGLTLNALSIRACRIRSKLENCMKSCSQEG